MRRALSHHGGRVVEHGDADLAALAARSLRDAQQAEADELTHGFHAWPARMHWAIARRVIRTIDPRGANVLDPFVGGGTTALEAMLAGARATGVDLNPLSALVARARTSLVLPEASERFVATARAVSAASIERVRDRVPTIADLPKPMLGWWKPHVLKELAGLREEIEAVEDPWLGAMLRVVLSAIVVKFSEKRADTAADREEKRVRKGLVSEFFERKAHELSLRWAAVLAAAPQEAIEPTLLTGDARELARVLGPDYRADLLVTSPPYGGTYDYVEQHVLRLAWLRLPAGPLESRELGSRRRTRDARAWDDEVRAMLVSMRDVLREGALAFLVVGDGQVGARRVDALEQLKGIAPSAGMEALGAASELKTDWAGGESRQEHVVVMRRPRRDAARAAGPRGGAGPGPGARSGSGAGPRSGTGPGPGARSGSGAGPRSGTGPGPGPRSGSGSGPGSRSGTGLGSRSGPGPRSGPRGAGPRGGGRGRG